MGKKSSLFMAFKCMVGYHLVIHASTLCTSPVPCMIMTGGLETEKDYPYEGKDDKCEFVKKEAEVFISGALNISSNEDGQ